MATHSFNRLTMGKEEIDNFFCLFGDIWIFFTEMFIEQSSTFHMTFVQIGEFDGLLGRQKRSIFVKMLKIFSETIYGMKPKLGIYAEYISLYISCVFPVG